MSSRSLHLLDWGSEPPTCQNQGCNCSQLDRVPSWVQEVSKGLLAKYFAGVPQADWALRFRAGSYILRVLHRGFLRQHWSICNSVVYLFVEYFREDVPEGYRLEPERGVRQLSGTGSLRVHQNNDSNYWISAGTPNQGADRILCYGYLCLPFHQWILWLFRRHDVLAPGPFVENRQNFSCLLVLLPNPDLFHCRHSNRAMGPNPKLATSRASEKNTVLRQDRQ